MSNGIINTIHDNAVSVHGAKITDPECNFADDSVDAMEIGLDMVRALGDATGIPIDTDVVNPAATALNRIRAGEDDFIDSHDFATIIWESFFSLALDGRTATGQDSATDMIGRTVRVGDVLAYSRADIDGTSSIELGLVTSLHSNDLVSDVATMFYGEHGQDIGAPRGGMTTLVSESLLARKNG